MIQDQMGCAQVTSHTQMIEDVFRKREWLRVERA